MFKIPKGVYPNIKQANDYYKVDLEEYNHTPKPWVNVRLIKCNFRKSSINLRNAKISSNSSKNPSLISLSSKKSEIQNPDSESSSVDIDLSESVSFFF